MFDIKVTRLQFEHAGMTYLALTVADLRGRGVDAEVILGAVKDHLSVEIDAAAERTRARFITPGVGQSLEYDMTEKQAEAALKGAASAATPAKFPMLAATIGTDIDPNTGVPAADVLGVARSVIAARDAWVEVGASIRETRLKAKAAVRAAASIEAAVAAGSGLVWPAS